MWNSRFASLSFDPFDNSLGFMFPPPEGLTLSDRTHLLVAQAFIPADRAGRRRRASSFPETTSTSALRSSVGSMTCLSIASSSARSFLR
jgi:hypothetical protein